MPLKTLLALSLFAMIAAGSIGHAADNPKAPAVPREFRAVWVATVANIDWPSRKGLSTEDQQKELIAILDKCKDLNINAVILQVRPMCDALYKSDLEPWSEFLSGVAGKAPEPYYDPLEFAVQEAHKRGIELHAWFNPYRAWQPAAHSTPPDNHVVKSRPDLAKKYGKHYWLNPTHKDVQDHSLNVMLDVVRRYDVDGIHMDDYFYPYEEKDSQGNIIPFPDDDTWADYQKSGGKLSRDDWRRAAVNQFVERLYKETKALKPWVKVGISPFGIWRPGHPDAIKGFDQFAKLYADAKLWLNKGWIDYWTPQLYWPIAKKEQSFPKLLAWWAAENTYDRHLWPGLGTHREDHPPREVADEIILTRRQPGASGHVHFSMKHIMRNNRGIADTLRELYAEPALVPASPWLGSTKPAKPEASLADSKLGWLVNVVFPGDDIRHVVVRSYTNGKWTTQIVAPSDRNRASAIVGAKPDQAIVTVVDRLGNESEAVEITPAAKP